MVLINSTTKSQCTLPLPDHGETIMICGDPVWSLAINEDDVHLTLLAKNNLDNIKCGDVGHIPNYVHIVYKSDNLTPDTPIMSQVVAWKLNALRTTVVYDRTDVQVGSVNIYPGFSERADLLRLIDDTTDRDEVISRISRYYKLLDAIRLEIFQNKGKLPDPVVDPVQRVLHEVLP